MLNFTGIGSAFNTELGNTSAFIKKGTSLLLIDCGGSVFHRLQELELLEDVQNLYIIITHTHPDHVGSLGDVIFYAKHILKQKPTIFFPQKELIQGFLTNIGVSNRVYKLNSFDKASVNDANLGEFSIKFVPVSHVETIPAYGFIMELNKKMLYYSGDANSMDNMILDKLKNEEIYRIYQDTCGLDYKGNGHLSLKKLCEVVPMEFRNKVYCMHLDKHITEQQIKDSGFNIGDKY
jgi:ribonuclease BN (tRNA processing enzyme)